MLIQIFQQVAGVVLDLFVYAFLLRFYMNAVGAPFYHPAARFIKAVTDFAVLPLRRVLPGLRRVDLASLLMAYVAILLRAAVLFLPALPGLLSRPAFYALGVTAFLRDSLGVLVWAMIIQAVLSWVKPYDSLSAVLDALTRPLLGRIRRVLPLIGGVDLSPLAGILLCQVAGMVVDRMEAPLLAFF